jgi:soluble lytic murein transglycosylase-like protein
MSENVKLNNLIERFGDFRGLKPAKKTSESVSESFKKKLGEMAAPDEGEAVPSRSRARRHQPPKIAKLQKELPEQQEKQPTLPKFVKSRSISMKHAKRLARYAPLIESAARKHNVPVELICGVILQESGANHRARSHCGARGLMQLMPATARRFGVKNSYDPAQNIEGGVKYLRWLLDRFDGNIELALAGYNAGEGNVEKYGNKIPPFRETQAYVPAVLSFTQGIVDIFSEKLAMNLPAYARKA